MRRKKKKMKSLILIYLHHKLYYMKSHVKQIVYKCIYLGVEILFLVPNIRLCNIGNELIRLV